jgi:hypothetical protein
MENKEDEGSHKERSFILGDSLPMTPPAGAKYIGTWDSVSGRMKWDNLVFCPKTQSKDAAGDEVSNVFQKDPHVEIFRSSTAAHVVCSQQGTTHKNLSKKVAGPKGSHKSKSKNSNVVVSLSESEEPIAGWRRRSRVAGKKTFLWLFMI